MVVSIIVRVANGYRSGRRGYPFSRIRDQYFPRGKPVFINASWRVLALKYDSSLQNNSSSVCAEGRKKQMSAKGRDVMLG